MPFTRSRARSSSFADQGDHIHPCRASSHLADENTIVVYPLLSDDARY